MVKTPQLVFLDRMNGLDNPIEGWEITPHPERGFPVVYAGCLPGSKIHACLYLGGGYTNYNEERILSGRVELRSTEDVRKRFVLVPDNGYNNSVCVCVAATGLLDEPLIQDPQDDQWKRLRRGEIILDRAVEFCMAGKMPNREIRHFFCLHDGGVVRLHVEPSTLPDIVCSYHFGVLKAELRYFDDEQAAAK